MFGNDGLRLNILRGEIFPHYWENKEDKDFNLNDDINIELCDSDFNNKSDDLLRRGQLWLTLEAKNKYHINSFFYMERSCMDEKQRKSIKRKTQTGVLSGFR